MRNTKSPWKSWLQFMGACALLIAGWWLVEQELMEQELTESRSIVRERDSHHVPAPIQDIWGMFPHH